MLSNAQRVVLVLALLVVPGLAAAQTTTWPQELEGPLATASAYVAAGRLSPRQWIASMDSYLQEAPGSAADFSTALDQLAPLLTEETLRQANEAAASDRSARLLRVARDRQQRPEVYVTIHKLYTKPTPPPGGWRQIARRSPHLSRSLFGEEYRLALEFYLMSPEFPGMWRGYRWSIWAGLAKAGHIESHSLLLHYYGMTCDMSLDVGRMHGLQHGFLVHLGSVQSEDSLRALLRASAH